MVKRAKQGGMGKLYLLLGAIAVVAVGAMMMSRGQPKVDDFAVNPSLPVGEAQGFTIGNPSAPVHVMEWADFECPACMQFATITEPDVRQRLVETGQVRFTYYFFPLEQHRNSAAASYAAACANDQGKFWEMHDAIYRGFSDWEASGNRNPKRVFRGYAESIGMDVAQWESCYDSDKHRNLIISHKAEGLRRGVQSTPTFVIGGRMVPGAVSYDRFKQLVDSATAAAPRTDSSATPAPAVKG